MFQSNQLSNLCAPRLVLAAQAAGSSTLSSAAVELSHHGVLFVVRVAVAGAGNKVAVAQSADGVTFTRLVGGEVVVEQAGETVVIDLYLPRQSLGGWARLEIERGAATAIETVYAFPYGGRLAAKPQDGATRLIQLSSPAAVGAVE